MNVLRIVNGFAIVFILLNMTNDISDSFENMFDDCNTIHMEVFVLLLLLIFHYRGLFWLLPPAIRKYSCSHFSGIDIKDAGCVYGFVLKNK